MKMFSDRAGVLIFALLLALSGVRCADGQAVTLAPAPQFTSFLQSGRPNAFGCVFTYASGTSNPLGTFTDYISGTANANPVVLTSGGTANIWFTTGSLYRVVVKTSGGVKCVSGSTIYTVDGVNSSLLNTANFWNANQTFSAPISLLPTDLQIVFGNPSGTQTTLDIPPTSANYILHGPPITANDTLLSQNAAQTVTNKNLTTGTQVNGCGMTNGPGAYICVPNNASTATVLNALAILTGAPSTATVAAGSASGGIVGIVTAGAGITGNATIQQSGQSNCIFDGATTAGDYFIASATAGDCHDSGAAFPASSSSLQVMGRVLSTNAGTGTYAVELFPPEIRTASSAAESTLSSISGTFSSLISLSPWYYFTNAHTLTRIYVHLTTQAVTCSTAAVISLKNESFNTILASVTVSNGVANVDSGPLTTTMTTTTPWGFEVTTAAAGCGTTPVGFVSATYQ